MEEGWKFSVIDIESGDVMFCKTYPEEYMEDAFAAFIEDAGGLDLGCKLEIVEVGD